MPPTPGTLNTSDGHKIETLVLDDEVHVPTSIVRVSDVDGNLTILQTDANNHLQVSLPVGSDGALKVSDPAWSYLGIDGAGQLKVVDNVGAAMTQQVRDKLPADPMTNATGTLIRDGIYTEIVRMEAVRDRLPATLTGDGRLKVDTTGGVVLSGRRPDGSYNGVASTTDDRLRVDTSGADTTTTGSIGANGAIVSAVAPAGANQVTIAFPGTWNATIQLEITFDGTNWHPYAMARGDAGAASATLTTAVQASNSWYVAALPAGEVGVRARATAYGTGPLSVRISFNQTPHPSGVTVGGSVSINNAISAVLAAGSNYIGATTTPKQVNDRSSTPLVANATFTDTLSVDMTGGAATGATTNAGWRDLTALAVSDQPGTLFLEVSTNGTTWRRVQPFPMTQPIAGGNWVAEFTWKPSKRYARLVYTNGSTAQTFFELSLFVTA